MSEQLFINGQWRAGRGEAFAAIDPATGAEVWRAPAADRGDVAEAERAAREAFPHWAHTPLETRCAIARRFAEAIRARKEPLARAISASMGKPLWEARTEVDSVAAKVEISITAQAERAGSRSTPAPFGETALSHRPHGVLAVLGPFNFPAHLPNGHIVPALLAGNTIVFKPSEKAPGVGAELVAAWAEAGLPAGALNLVQGGRDVAEALLDAPIDGVLFTGSAQAGCAIHARFAGRPEVILALEMGGNNPLIVWPPADPAISANLIAHSAFATSGQRCSCARRLIVPHGQAGDAVVEALAALCAKLEPKPGDADPPAFLGPLVSEAAAVSAERAVEGLIVQGARAIIGFRRSGAFVWPCVLDTTAIAAPDSEIFAPVLQVLRARDFDEALNLANATRFGLAGGLISEDAHLWARAQSELRAGVLNWNRPTTGASSHLPFGGPGLSGNHRPSAFYAADYCAWPSAMQVSPRLAAIPAPGLPG